MFQKIGACDKPRWLISRAAEKKCFAGFAETIGELLQCVDAGCVKRSHIPKAQDHNISKWPQISGRFCKLLRCREKKWSVNTENGDIGGNVLVLENMRLPIFQIFACDWRNRRRLRDAIDIEERCQRHADSYGHREVGENSQSKGRKPNGNIGLR